MAGRGRPKAELVLTEEERETLSRWARRRKSSQALALRSRIVLGCAEGLSNKEVAARERVAQPTVGKWRARFVEARCDGLVDEPRPGRPASVTAEQVEDVVVATLESTPANATHWSRTSMAERAGLSKSTIGRIWKAFELQPHRSEDFKLSNDPLFVEKVYDIVGRHNANSHRSLADSHECHLHHNRRRNPQPQHSATPRHPTRLGDFDDDR
ncbi:IS630 family transposase [Mycobacterium sp.]|uniref:IS630 family transposase n=1 Tax=Mycobacterium sp. TaxID=1785 RepID=UPI0028B7323A|nr:family transposase [Mycobacterium sp.]MDT5052755.1 hypothetical protein [Mycobacterium sp.]